jgi:hypothetical protein
LFCKSIIKFRIPTSSLKIIIPLDISGKCHIHFLDLLSLCKDPCFGVVC